MYPVIFFDALRGKILKEGLVRNKAIYMALGFCPMARAIFWVSGTIIPKASNSG